MRKQVLSSPCADMSHSVTAHGRKLAGLQMAWDDLGLHAADQSVLWGEY